MGKLKGLFKVEGTLDGVTFYKTQDGNLVRMKGGASREKIMHDPNFARTRENLAEFKSAVKTGKMFRDSLRWFIKGSHDRRVSSRLTQIMSRALKEDQSSSRGFRTPAMGLTTAEGKALLSMFNFNKGAEIGSVLYKTWTLDSSTGVIDLGNIDPLSDISSPAGATHFSISGGMEIIDLETGIYDLQITNVVNAALGSTTIPVTLTPAAIPTGTGNTFFFLKVEFFQMVNAVQYPLRDEKFNAVAIIGVL